MSSSASKNGRAWTAWLSLLITLCVLCVGIGAAYQSLASSAVENQKALADHEARLRSVERTLTEMAADVRVIRQTLERYVESESGGRRRPPDVSMDMDMDMKETLP